MFGNQRFSFVFIRFFDFVRFLNVNDFPIKISSKNTSKLRSKSCKKILRKTYLFNMFFLSDSLSIVEAIWAPKMTESRYYI